MHMCDELCVALCSFVCICDCLCSACTCASLISDSVFAICVVSVCDFRYFGYAILRGVVVEHGFVPC